MLSGKRKGFTQFFEVLAVGKVEKLEMGLMSSLLFRAQLQLQFHRLSARCFLSIVNSGTAPFSNF